MAVSYMEDWLAFADVMSDPDFDYDLLALDAELTAYDPPARPLEDLAPLVQDGPIKGVKLA